MAEDNSRFIVPTVELFKDGERVVVREADQAAWKADGWKAKKPAKAADPAPATE